MIEFNEEFFKAEEREGFWVSETMKRYWACCMDIVDVIDSVCKKYGLTYYADWGTLLGVVRHQGFVPWDDDMDIALKRPDYEKLMKVLPQELPKGFSLSNSFINEKHRQFFSGVSNGKELNLSKEHMAAFHECPFVATIDIFPIDYLPRNKEEAEVLESLFVMIWGAIELIINEAPEAEIENAVCQVENYLNIKIERTEHMRSKLWQIANQLVMSYGEADGDYLIQWCAYVNNKKRIYKKQWYDEVEYKPFESMLLPIPKEEDKILTAMYGDWRTPVRGTQVHDYPAFGKQLEFLKRKVAEMKAEQSNNGEI